MTEYVEALTWGEQVNRVTTGIKVDEWRYWDDIAASTRRIGSGVPITTITTHPSILSLSASDAVGQGLAPSQSNLATASKLAFKMRIKGDKLITGDLTGALFDLFQLYDPGVGRKIGCQISNSAGSLVLLSMQTLDGNGNVFTAGYAMASIDVNAYYRLYFHYDQTFGADKQHLSLYDDAGTLLDDKTSNYSGGQMGTAATSGAAALNKWVQSSSSNYSILSIDWIAFYDGALAVGAGRYSAPLASDVGILSGWDFNEGAGTSAGNIVNGAQAMTIGDQYNWF